MRRMGNRIQLYQSQIRRTFCYVKPLKGVNMIENTRTGEIAYVGATFAESEHFWLDGMLEVFAESWNMETHEIVSTQVGYFGIDCRNMCPCEWKIDISAEAARDMIRTVKRNAAKAFAKSVIEEKQRIAKGRNCVVIKGRKVPKGTKINVFWVGERPTYRSRHYDWMNETETVAGGYTSDGMKVWIKADYLKVIDGIKSPDRRNREAFIRKYVERNVPLVVRNAARGIRGTESR